MVELVPNARQVFLDASGAPLVGGFVYMYVMGGTTPATTYSDSAGLIPNSNPIVLDALGSATIWGEGSYTQRVTDRLGNLVFSNTTTAPNTEPPLANSAGIMAWFTTPIAPNGWLECNGAAVSRTTYALLFSAIGTEWGTGDGATTFNVPDFRGYFIRGWDDGANVDPNRQFGNLQNLDSGGVSSPLLGNYALLPCISTGVSLGNANGGVLVLAGVEVVGPTIYQMDKSHSLIDCDCRTGVIVVDAPNQPVPYQVYWFKDIYGTSNNNPVEFDFEIDGVTGQSLNASYAGLGVYLNSVGTWSQLT